MKRGFGKVLGNKTAAIVTAVLLILGGFGGAAIAVTVGSGTLGNFEQDGNFAVDSAGHLDWANVTPTIVTDDTADSGFTQGSKELDPSNWVCGTGGANPDKGNILRAYVDSRISASSAYVDLAWIRQGVSGGGDVHLNFEFSQHGTAQNPADFVPGPCPIDRANGDLLITYDFPGGSSNPDIKAFKWDASATNWVDQNLPASAAKAAVNQVSVPDPFDGTIDPGRFGEATIDLLAAIPPDPNGHCTTFGYLNVRSRSSGESITSALQDKLPTTAIDLSTCGKIIVHKTDDHTPPHPLAGAVFGLFKNSGATGTPIAQATSIADGSATFNTVDPGTYYVKELVAPSADYTIDPTIAGPITVAFRQTVDVTSHVFVNPRKVGTLHIVKLVNDGNGNPISPLNLAGLNGTSFVVFKDANSNGHFDAGEEAKLWPAETTDATCTISGGLGYCNVGPLPTGTYGVHELTAPAGTQMGPDIYPVAILTSGQTVNVPFTNTVRVSARLSLTPNQAANQVGHTHTFTAHLELDHGDGNGFVNAPAGETINFTKVSGPGSLSSSSCTTNASGQCTVNLNSSVTGLTTVRASWSGLVSTNVGPAPASTTSNDAVKRWTDAHLVLTPPAAANQVGATHTFVATLTFDYGDGHGFVAAPAGETINFTKASGPGSLASSSCSTNASGVCSVNLTSSTTGLSTVNASWSGHIATAEGNASAGASSGDALKRWTNAHLVLSPAAAANQIGNKHTITATLTFDYGDGQGFVAAPAGETINFTKASGPGSLSSPVCTTNASGQCTVDLNSSATGLSDVQASWSGSIGTAQGSATASTTSNHALKRWVDAHLALTPPTAVNRIGDTHTFTASLTFDYGDGHGFVAAPAGETIDITKTSGPGTLSASSCTTNASGQCTVDLNSLQTGTTDVQANWAGNVATAQGNAAATAQGSAEKIWVDALIQISPPQAADQVGDNHVLTISLSTVTNGASSPAAGVLATASITGGPGSFVGPDTCTTNASGECTVTIRSTTPGVTTIQASADVNVNGKTVHLVTDGQGNDPAPAQKRWVDAHLTLDPPAAANQVGATHTFTAHLTYNYGDGHGFVDAPSGETIHVTKASGPGTLSASSCTTNTNGECTVDLSSSTTGLTTVDASWNGNIATASGSASASAASNDALKRWTNAHLTLTPPSAANQVGVTHTFTAHLTFDYGDGHGFVTAPAGESIDLSKASGPGTLSAASCTTNASGECTVDLTSSSTGLTTVDASWNGHIATAQGSASASASSNDAVKRWVDASLTLSPPSAVNRVGDVHVFTAHLTFDYGDGHGFVDAPSGQTIDISKVSGPGTLSAASCSTNASGECTVNLNSSTTGTTDVEASWNGKIATAQGDAVASAHGDAEKIWVDALMIINPPQATNEVGNNHVFTIDVNQIVNGVTSAAANVDVTATIASGPGSFVGSNVCTTNAAGECTVTIVSNTTGLTTVEAAATVNVNGKAIVLVTNGQGGNAPPAIKRWVNARLSVTPPDATNIVGHVHVFTAHLELDFGDGNGFVNAPAGETINWGKTSGVGTLSSTTCTTDANGTCTDNLNSLVSGQTEVQASWNGFMTTAEGTASLARTADAHKNWVAHPAINIVKSGAALAHEGDVVTYSFKVTNTGDVPLSNVTVTDDVLGAIGNVGDLAVGQDKTATKDFTVPANTTGVTNIGTACGVDSDNTQVCDTDPHSLIVIHPTIQIVKTANPTTADPGQTVTYTYVVTNTGDTTLNNVVVTDDVIGNIGTITSLKPSESQTLTKQFTVAANSPRTNIGQACGTDVLNKTVCDTDPATISIVLPIPPQVRLPKTGFAVLLWTAFGMVLVAAGLAMMKTRREFLGM
jgi:uncharacterized repeat protein (TIGR01451 family)